MKKIFTLIAVAFAMTANAQYVEFNTSALSDALTDVAAGTVMGTADNGIVASTAFADKCKIVGVSASKYDKISFNGSEASLAGGYQGNANPKDADGGNPANTLKPAASGSVLIIDVPTTVESGYIYVVGKFSQNKQYVVTEDNSFIGYTIVCDGTAAGKAGQALTAEVKGDDADKYFVTTPIGALGSLNGAGTDAANNGVGFIKFSVWGGCKYAVHAAGSKLTQCGFYYSATGDEKIVVTGTDVPEITLQVAGGADGIESVKTAAVKADAAAYNLAGQKVAADYKGLVIVDGKKMIRK